MQKKIWAALQRLPVSQSTTVKNYIHTYIAHSEHFITSTSVMTNVRFVDSSRVPHASPRAYLLHSRLEEVST